MRNLVRTSQFSGRVQRFKWRGKGRKKIRAVGSHRLFGSDQTSADFDMPIETMTSNGRCEAIDAARKRNVRQRNLNRRQMYRLNCCCVDWIDGPEDSLM